MAISDKTRKRLWAKSGNRCAICKVDLFADSSNAEIFNIGDECHIISGRVNGPRYKVGLSDYDDFDNLLLLCKNHHKEIDELPETYSEEVLRFMKTSHENFIKRAISTAADDEKGAEEKPRFLARITSGKDILEIIWNVHGYNFDYDESESEEDLHYIASFLQNLQDYGELVAMGEIEISQKISIGTELTSYIKNLEVRGFYVFGERFLGNIIHEGQNLNNWTIGNVYVKKKESTDIVYPEQLFDFLINKTPNGSSK